MQKRTQTLGQLIGLVSVFLLVILSVFYYEEPQTLGENTQEYATVIRIIDGDTIELVSGQTVRYIGIDTPETTGTPECWAIEAERFNSDLVLNKKVRLVKDVSETDRYGRLLRYVYVDDLFVNAELVKEGYAQTATYPPDILHEDTFTQLESKARSQNKGLWSGCQFN